MSEGIDFGPILIPERKWTAPTGKGQPVLALGEGIKFLFCRYRASYLKVALWAKVLCSKFYPTFGDLCLKMKTTCMYASLIILFLLVPNSLWAQASRVTVYIDRTLPSLKKARGHENKCNVISEWLLRYPREFHDEANMGNLRRSYTYHRNVVLVFRDQDFIQVFGKSYDDMSQKEIDKLLYKAVGPCLGINPKHYRYTNPHDPKLRPFQDVIKNAFGSKRIEYIRKLQEVRAARRWMDESLQELKLDAKVTYDLLKEMEKDKRLELLWPSEKKHFRNQIDFLKQQISEKQVSDFIATFDRYPDSLEGAQQLQRDYTALRRKVILSRSQKRMVALRMDDKTSSSVARELNAVHNRFMQLPNTIEGFAMAVKELRAFRRNFDKLDDMPIVSKTRKEILAKNNRIFEVAKAQWTEMVTSTPYNKKTLIAQGEYLNNLFPDHQYNLNSAYAQLLEPILVKASRVYAETIEPQFPLPSSYASPYIMPTLVDALGKGDFEKIPDDQMTRQYIASIMRALTEECNKGWGSMAPRIVKYGLDMSANDPAKSLGRMFDSLGKSMRGDLVGAEKALGPTFIKEGYDDGVQLSEDFGCDSSAMSKLRSQLIRLVNQRYQRKPQRDNLDRFFSLMSPKYRKEKGISFSIEKVFDWYDLLIVSCLENYGQAKAAHCRCLVNGLANSDVYRRYEKSLLVHFSENLIHFLQKNYKDFEKQTIHCRGME